MKIYFSLYHDPLTCNAIPANNLQNKGHGHALNRNFREQPSFSNHGHGNLPFPTHSHAAVRFSNGFQFNFNAYQMKRRQYNLITPPLLPGISSLKQAELCALLVGEKCPLRSPFVWALSGPTLCRLPGHRVSGEGRNKI